MEHEDWQDTLAWMILPIGRIWYRAASRAFADFEMSFSSAAPILAIARMGDGVRHQAVADAIGVDRAALVRSIDQLQTQGLVERRVDPDDRRGRTLHLTARGREMAQHLALVARRIREEAFASVTAADGQAAIRALAELERSAAAMAARDRSKPSRSHGSGRGTNL